MGVIAVLWTVGPVLDWGPIDFSRFYAASKMILAGENPYGRLPFFAPPWLALLLAPFAALPRSSAALAWTVANIALLFLSVTVISSLAGAAARPRLLLAIPSAFLPYAVFSYITGQLSIVALASCVLCLWGLHNRRSNAVAAGLVLATLKAHIVALPMLLVLLTAIRRRRWSILVGALLALGALCVLSTVFLWTWPIDWIAAVASGSFYEPRENLLGVAAFGVPLWLTLPFVAYTIVTWCRRPFNLDTLGLGVAANLLAMPYTRSYDYVLLLIPTAAVCSKQSSPRRNLAVVVVLLAQLLPLARALIPGAGLLEAIAPSLCMGAILLSADRTGRLHD